MWRPFLTRITRFTPAETWSTTTLVLAARLPHEKKGSFSKTASAEALILSARQALMQPIPQRTQVGDYWEHHHARNFAPSSCRPYRKGTSKPRPSKCDRFLEQLWRCFSQNPKLSWSKHSGLCDVSVGSKHFCCEITKRFQIFRH